MILAAGLLLFGAPSPATAAPIPSSGSCKQIVTILAEIALWQRIMIMNYNTYESWKEQGEEAQAKKALKSFGNAEKDLQKSLDKGARVAKSPDVKKQFKRWSNAFRLSLPSSGRVADQSQEKIESLMFDGKC